MADKKKILFLSDHPLVPSGVGIQAKQLIEGLLATGKYRFVCLGGALKHPDMRPQKVNPEKYGDDWLIYPVEGHGNKDIVRQMLNFEKPDAIFMFTDPRFFVWLWEMEDEVRSVCPLVYWHVWDNDPTPKFNKIFYDSTDSIAALSLKTYGLLQDIGYEKDRFTYIPHAVSKECFKPLQEEEVQKYKRDHLGPHADKKFILFWNNRNARRKMTGDVIGTFAKFAQQVGKENVALMMHTAVHDPEGQDILAVAEMYGVSKNLIVSEQRIEAGQMNMLYNVVDCTMNIANNEGFGLGTLESLSSGTPIIVHMTGGLQFQIGDWWDGITDYTNQDKLTAIAKKKWSTREGKWFGIPVFPASRSCTGSQPIPYIYDDRVAHEDVVKALVRVYEMGRTKRKELGLQAREWVMEKFNEQKLIADFDSFIQKTMDRCASSKNRGIRTATL